MNHRGGLALAFGAMMAATPAALAQAPPNLKAESCFTGAVGFSGGKYEEALPNLRTCIADTTLPDFERAAGYGYYVRSLEKLGRIDETIAELRKITAPPWSDMPGFVPPTLAMQKIKESDVFVGLSQPQLILDLAALLAEQGKTDEALVEATRVIKVARAMRADLLAEEEAGWTSRATLLQDKDETGFMAALIRAFVRGGEHPVLEQFVSGQKPDVQAKLRQMRTLMTEHRPKVAYQDAWAASLGKPFDPTAPDIAASVEAVRQVEADEEALVGPIEL